jgi:hypothetical protein
VRAILPEERWAPLAEECDTLVTGDEERELDHLTRKYSHLRSFQPEVLELFAFRSYQPETPLRRAIEVTRALDKGEIDELPQDVATDFMDEGTAARLMRAEGPARRRLYEFTVGQTLEDEIRTNDTWLDEARDSARFSSELLSEEEWEAVYVLEAAPSPPGLVRPRDQPQCEQPKAPRTSSRPTVPPSSPRQMPMR